MKQTNIPLKIIGLFDIPAPVADVLASHWQGQYDVQRLVDSETCPDLVITTADTTIFPAIPVLRLEKQLPLNVTRIGQLAEDMIAAPALYLEDVAIGIGILKTPDKILIWDGRDIALTDKEVDIIICLAKAQGKPVARQKLLSLVWGYQNNIDTHTLETHIYRLRQKIGEAAQFIMTDDKGYFIALPGQ